jgi:Tol biopolymer transport system component
MIRNKTETWRASMSSSAVQGDGDSYGVSLSGDGQLVAFWSTATNLVSGDTNGLSDAFVASVPPALPPTPTPTATPTPTPQVDMISVSSSGVAGNGDSGSPSVSNDGRYVAFHTLASNLVSGDTNGISDVYLRDRNAGTTVRIGPGRDPEISADGRFVAYEDDQLMIRVYELATSQTEVVSKASSGEEANNDSRHPTISSDGRYVAFSTRASNLAAGDTNNDHDIYVHDRTTAQTTKISTSTVVSNSASISGDGRLVAFVRPARSFVTSGDILVHDRQTGVTTVVSPTGGIDEQNDTPLLSGDGRYVAYTSDDDSLVPGDTNGGFDGFVHDLQTGAVELGSINPDGSQVCETCGGGISGISDTGRFVTFSSSDHVMVRDRTEGVTVKLVEGWAAGLSGDGAFIAFIRDSGGILQGYVVLRVTPDPIPAAGLMGLFLILLAFAAATVFLGRRPASTITH